MNLTLVDHAFGTLIVSLGSVLQAATGLGAGLIIVPLLGLIDVRLVPGPMIFASMALSGAMTVRGRREIDFAHAVPLLGGVCAGTLVAAYLIALVPFAFLGVVFGCIILLGVLLSLRAPRFTLSSRAYLSAGALAGLLGTAAGIGAPVLALVYQHESGPRLRATLAFLYLVSSVVMLVFLHMAGRFAANDMLAGLTLVPGFVLGFFLAPLFARRIDRGLARPVVLVISTLSALLLIWRSVAAAFDL